MKSLRGYPKVWNIGHPSVDRLFEGPVVVQEKVDGSQFSFGIVDGNLCMRSKGAEIYYPVRDKLFQAAVETVQELGRKGLLQDGWVYRGEVLCSPRHNSLTYNRVPVGNIILFDIDIGEERRLLPELTAQQAQKLGLEVVPTLFEGVIDNVEAIKELLDRRPYLGGEMIEGIVVKNYAIFSQFDGKQLMGKFVAEKYRERHSRQWKKDNPGTQDIVTQLINCLVTEARYEKAVQRRRDAGELQHAPQDIGPLMKDLSEDLETEEQDFIKEKLYAHFHKQILRGVAGGLPAWYKKCLLTRAFDPVEKESDASRA